MFHFLSRNPRITSPGYFQKATETLSIFQSIENVKESGASYAPTKNGGTPPLPSGFSIKPGNYNPTEEVLILFFLLYYHYIYLAYSYAVMLKASQNAFFGGFGDAYRLMFKDFSECRTSSRENENPSSVSGSIFLGWITARRIETRGFLDRQQLPRNPENPMGYLTVHGVPCPINSPKDNRKERILWPMKNTPGF